MKLNSFIKIILPVLIIALSIGSFKYLKTNKAERTKPQVKEKVWLIETQDVELENMAPDLTLYATIESPALHAASSPASAIVKSVNVKPGYKVHKGDVLIALEQQDFVNSVNQVKADRLDIKAQLLQLQLKYESNQKALDLENKLLALSQAELDRVKRLQQKGLGSKSVLTDAKSALAKQQLSVLNKSNEVAQFAPKKQQLEAKLMRLNAALDQANLALTRSIIKATFDGIIVSVDTAQGDRVKTAQKLITLYPTQQLEAKTRIPARYQQEIQQMLQSQQPVTANATLSGHSISMQLERIAGQAAANGIDVYFRITQGQEFLRIGHFLKLNVKRNKQHNLIKMPLQALYGTAKIFILKEGRLQGLKVDTLGHFRNANGQQSILIHHPDLKNGDKIIVTHLPNAITGLKVKTSEQ